jgi:thioredoxin 1
MVPRTAELDSVASLGDDTIESVVGNDGVALLAFHTEWCGACQRMRPALGTIAADTDARVLTIDIESHLETAIEFGAQSAPTVVLFVDGRPVKRVRGARTEQSLRDLMGGYDD